MIIGYGRVSTRGQARDGNSLEYQKEALCSAGAEKLFFDTYTGKVNERPELDKMLKVLKTGDTLVVTKLDRIARSVSGGSELINKLNDRGISVNILNIGILNNDPSGNLLKNIMLAFAEFERDMIVQRTQEGKAIAKKRPDYREGRPKKYTQKQLEHAMELKKTHSYKQVTELTGISESTLIREFKKVKGYNQDGKI